MANIKGSLFSRVVGGMLNLEVEFQYEAAYSYEVADRVLFEQKTGGNFPLDIMNDMVTLCFMRAFQETYPEGLTLNEMEKPDQMKLMQNLKRMVDEKSMQFFGIVLASFTLASFQADPAALAQIQRLQAMQKTPQEMAQGMIALMREATGGIGVQQVRCGYCDSMVVLTSDGKCPSCGAPLR